MKKTNLKFNSFFDVLKSTPRSQVAVMVLDQGKSTGGKNNQHTKSDQWMCIVSGNGKAIIEKDEVKLQTGDLLLIEAGENHEIINTGKEKLETFNIYAPPVY